jgi:hypothetical protein
MVLNSPLTLSAPGGNPAFVHPTRRSESGSLTGSGRRIAASTRLKIAAFAPMPIVSERTTAALRPGVLRS